MTQTICVVYKPGAYGSFISWAIDRFSDTRKQYQPSITDNPLLPDGSSHGYASFCKIKTNDDFMQGLNTARRVDVPWGYQIFAGWPNDNINVSLTALSKWMATTDKLIVVNCATPEDHMLCYLRNEATMNKDRWYGMLNISSDSELLNALQADIDAEYLDVAAINDQRILTIDIQSLLTSDPYDIFNKLSAHLEWAVCDKELFVDVMLRMQALQISYIQKLMLLKQTSRSAETPAELAIQNYLKGVQ